MVQESEIPRPNFVVINLPVPSYPEEKVTWALHRIGFALVLAWIGERLELGLCTGTVFHPSEFGIPSLADCK